MQFWLYSNYDQNPVNNKAGDYLQAKLGDVCVFVVRRGLRRMDAPATHGAAHWVLSPALHLGGPEEGGLGKSTQSSELWVSLSYFSSNVVTQDQY